MSTIPLQLAQCDIANELEQITRLSILRMLSPFKHYDNKQENTSLINIIDKVAIGHRRGILERNLS